MKKFVKILLCIAMCFTVLAGMGVAVSAKDVTPPCDSAAVLTYHIQLQYYSGAGWMSCSQSYTNFDMYWSGVGYNYGYTDSLGNGYIDVSSSSATSNQNIDWSWGSSVWGNVDYGTYQAALNYL